MRYLFLAILFLAGCGIFSEKVSIDDPRIPPLLKEAAHFERLRYGFTPLPSKAEVRWESKPTKKYDAMLHIAVECHDIVDSFQCHDIVDTRLIS